MERMPFLICDERQRETCKHGPDCEKLQRTQHHLRPQRLLKFAREALASIEYQTTLRKVIKHPNNIVETPRCLHDYLDTLTNDELPPQAELEHTLEVWNTP